MQDVAIQPHNNLHFIRIVQEGEGKCSNNSTKEFGERKESVAGTATGLEPNSFAILGEYSLLTIIRPTNSIHTREISCNHLFTYSSIPSRKQVSMPKSRLSQFQMLHFMNF